MITHLLYAIFFVPLIGKGIDSALLGNCSMKCSLKRAHKFHVRQHLPETLYGFQIRYVVGRRHSDHFPHITKNIFCKLVNTNVILCQHGFKTYGLHLIYSFYYSVFGIKHMLCKKVDAFRVSRNCYICFLCTISVYKILIRKNPVIRAAHTFNLCGAKHLFRWHVKKLEFKGCTSCIAYQDFHCFLLTCFAYFTIVFYIRKGSLFFYKSC